MNKTEEKGKEKSISDFLKVELTVEVQKIMLAYHL